MAMSIPDKHKSSEQLHQYVGEDIKTFVLRVSKAEQLPLHSTKLYRKVVSGLTQTIRICFLTSPGPKNLHWLFIFSENLRDFLPADDPHWVGTATDSGKRHWPNFTVTRKSETTPGTESASTSASLRSANSVPAIDIVKPKETGVVSVKKSWTKTTPSISWSMAPQDKRDNWELPTAATFCLRCQEHGHFARHCYEPRAPLPPEVKKQKAYRRGMKAKEKKAKLAKKDSGPEELPKNQVPDARPEFCVRPVVVNGQSL